MNDLISRIAIASAKAGDEGMGRAALAGAVTGLIVIALKCVEVYGAVCCAYVAGLVA